ncbi:segregation and condensation protein B [Anaerosphaera aminiphila DSM 21120]|uniref:Segregation and condensation protein B n=1 Tax=Anaerosphaera aminiphila DSM 21120 TaxID=1120995 RepID=A0A1M5P8K5_9FIRM|nr:SMC-Scp complex subunit ScpB [Anaerosphaera aminiphila]SHG98037.1 segregation and condensation protein B [Anaerosphaera aminiphila DSM 21120]
MDNEKIKSIIEGILFAWADPVNITDLSKVLEVSPNKIRELILAMQDDYEQEERGLRILQVNESFQLSTKPENYDYISEFVSTKNKKNLSNASLETLSIIAYKQPVTKIEVEEIRGVKCDSSIRALIELGLIEITGQLNKIGRPNIYETTEEFLKKFGLKSIDDLPAIEDENQLKINFLEEQ